MCRISYNLDKLETFRGIKSLYNILSHCKAMTLLGSTVAASSGTFIAGMLIPSINSKGIIAGYCFTIFPGACALIGLFVIPRRMVRRIKKLF